MLSGEWYGNVMGFSFIIEQCCDKNRSPFPLLLLFKMLAHKIRYLSSQMLLVMCEGLTASQTFSNYGCRTCHRRHAAWPLLGWMDGRWSVSGFYINGLNILNNFLNKLVLSAKFRLSSSWSGAGKWDDSQHLPCFFPWDLVWVSPVLQGCYFIFCKEGWQRRPPAVLACDFFRSRKMACE